MVYFGCKVTKKTVIFQNFLQKNIKLSVFLSFLDQMQGEMPYL